jgi:spore coat protein CotH
MSGSKSEVRIVRTLSLVRHVGAVLLVGLAFLMPAGGARVHAETAADFFDLTAIQEIRLRFHTRDLAELRVRYNENVFFPVMVQWRGIRVWNVGVRVRGLGSRQLDKLPLLLDFTRYATRQRFLGVSSIVLDNHWQDPASMRERVALTFFSRMGQPAPRVASARLYINDAYQGLYTAVEAVDAAFLARHFNDVVGRTNPGGFLYEYRQLGAYYGTYLGDSLAPYKERFEARTRTKEADTTLYSPIRDLIREVNGPYDAVWRSRVEQYLDLRQLVTYVAIENFLAEWDGVTGEWGMNNFYLYRPANSTRHRLIVWDPDLTFYDLAGTIFQRSDQNVLFSRAIGFSDLRAIYLDVMEQCARSASQDRWLETHTAFVAALVSTVAFEAVRVWSREDIAFDTARILEFARLRPAKVLAEVALARGSSGQ